MLLHLVRLVELQHQRSERSRMEPCSPDFGINLTSEDVQWYLEHDSIDVDIQEFLFDGEDINSGDSEMKSPFSSDPPPIPPPMMPSSPPYSLSSHPSSPSSSIPFESDINQIDIYHQCIHDSLDALRNLEPRQLSNPFKQSELFKLEEKSRLRIGKGETKSHYRIFPWFQYRILVHEDDRFRETVKNKEEIPRILEAMNFFWSRRYSPQDLEKLGQVFLSVEEERDKKDNVFTRIIHVHRMFTMPDVSSSPVATSDDSLRNLTQRVDRLEEFVGIHDDSSPGLKRCRSSEGGDRACWYKIRDADYPSRNHWCYPGAVFGLYSDGVGKLRPHRNYGPKMSSILVYSVSPDVTEQHPDPSHHDHYVRVVMV